MSQSPTARRRSTATWLLRGALTALVMLVLWVGAAIFATLTYEWSLPEPQPLERLFASQTLHPFTGFHHDGPPASLRAPPDELRDMTGNRPYREHDSTVNVLGFADSINVLDPPPKPDDELRIIVIGGSGAQGQGASRMLERFEVKLEEWINQRLAARTPGSGWHVRFINMGMGGAITYQNFVQLNRWGRALQPDAIISYSGRNELWMAGFESSDGYYLFHQVAYLVTIQDTNVQPDEPRFIRLFARYLPRIYHHTALRVHVKSLFFGEIYKVIALARYRAQLGYDKTPPGGPSVLRAIAIPRHVHGLKSIKRDLLGVPIVLAWQRLADTELPTIPLAERDYDDAFEAVRRDVAGYCNDDWMFLNAHAIMRSMQDPSLGGAHLTDKGHTVLAQLLLEPMHELVMRLIARRKAGTRPIMACDATRARPFVPGTAKP